MANHVKEATPKPNELSAAITPFSWTANDTITCDYKDERTILIITVTLGQGKSAWSAKIKAGNGYAGSAEDLELAGTASGVYAITLDSARFKNVSGSNAGKIVLGAITDATATVMVVEATV